MRDGDHREMWYYSIVYGSKILNEMAACIMKFVYGKDCCVTGTCSWDYEAPLGVSLGSGTHFFLGLQV